MFDLLKTIRVLTRTFILCLKNDFPIKILFACDILFESLQRFPKSTRFPHPVGIVVGPNVTVGENCMICQNVTLGGRPPHTSHGPKIGSRVYIGANALILGQIKVGDYCIIGAGSIVLKDVPAKTVVKGVWKG